MNKIVKTKFKDKKEMADCLEFTSNMLDVAKYLKQAFNDRELAEILSTCLYHQFWNEQLKTIDEEGFFNFEDLNSSDLSDSERKYLVWACSKCAGQLLIKYKQKSDGSYWAKINEDKILELTCLRTKKYYLIAKLKAQKLAIETYIKNVLKSKKEGGVIKKQNKNMQAILEKFKKRLSKILKLKYMAVVFTILYYQEQVADCTKIMDKDGFFKLQHTNNDKAHDVVDDEFIASLYEYANLCYLLEIKQDENNDYWIKINTHELWYNLTEDEQKDFNQWMIDMIKFVKETQLKLLTYTMEQLAIQIEQDTGQE